jgi:hypothetical protein
LYSSKHLFVSLEACAEYFIALVGPLTWISFTEYHDTAVRNIENALTRAQEFFTLHTVQETHAHEKELVYFQRLLEFGKGGVPWHTPPSPTTRNNLRLPDNLAFFGRHDELEKIEKALQPSVSTSSFSSLLLHGVGGVGKTQTALRFSHSKLDVLDCVLWVSAENDTALANAYSEIAVSILKIPGTDLSEDLQNRIAVLDWLQKTCKSCLFS